MRLRLSHSIPKWMCVMRRPKGIAGSSPVFPIAYMNTVTHLRHRGFATERAIGTNFSHKSFWSSGEAPK